MRIHKHPYLLILLLLLAFLFLPGCAGSEYKVLVLTSSSFDPSFAAIEQAAETWAAERGASITVRAPYLAQIAAQQEILEEEITGTVWDLICIEPLDAAALSPLLEYAQAQGTVVVTVRGQELACADYNIEPFALAEMGEQLMDALGSAMGETGMYITMIPAASDNRLIEIEEAASNIQRTRYANMFAASRLDVSANDAVTAYEILDSSYEKYQISGALFLANGEGVGAGEWIQASGLDIACVGIGNPDQLSPYVESGALSAVYYWSSAHLVEAALRVGYYAVSGQQNRLGDVITLDVEGYETLRHTQDNTWVARDIRQVTP